MSDLSAWIEPVFWRVTLAGTVRLATPIAFAAIGEMVAERAGTLNLSVDAVMTAAALAAVIAAAFGGWVFGLAAAAAIGLVLGLAMAALTVARRLNQIVAGIAVSLIGYGLTETVFQLWQPSGELAPLVQRGSNSRARLCGDRRRHHRPLDPLRRARWRAAVRHLRQLQPSSANASLGLAR